MARDGSSLYSLLTSLQHPSAASLSPESLDWVCEADGCHQFIDWFLTSVSKDNVLEDEELEAYNLIPEDERLSGQILSDALSSFGITDGQRMTDAELEKQVNTLEVELRLMENSCEKLSHIRDMNQVQLSRSQTEIGQMDHLMDRLELEERRSQEMILELNNNYNKTVDQLLETVAAVSKMYEAAQEDMDNPAFVASIDLNKIRAADAALDEEIEQLMQVYFEKNENPNVSPSNELLRGRNEEEHEIMMSEMSRLRVSWTWQEFERIKLKSQEARLTAALVTVNQDCSLSKEKHPNVIESREKLEEDIMKTLDDIADLHCQNILNIDCSNKETRNRRVIARLEEIRDVLLQQVAKREILAVLVDKEKKEVGSVEDMLRDVIKCFKDEATQINNFKTAMKSLSEKKSESEANLIPVEDGVMTKVHRVLYNHQLVGHLPVYNQVFEALETLKNRKTNLEKQLQSKKSSQTEDFHSATKKMSQIFSLMEIGSSKKVSLSPKNIRTGIILAEKEIREIKDELKKAADDWDKDIKEIKLKPETTLVRNLWIDFLVRPKSLIASMKNLENKVNR